MNTSAGQHKRVLVNQSALLLQLVRQWEQAAKDDYAVSVFIIDVDRFSQLENRAACFERILGAVHGVFNRETDFMARFNRKQIMAVTSHMNFRQSTQLSSRIHRSVAQLELFHPYSPTGRYATVSIGHSTYAPRPRDNYGVLDMISTVLCHVDNAKHNGGNCSMSRLHSRVLK